MTDATGAPIQGLQVCARPYPIIGELPTCSTTNSGGEYTIALSPHAYEVEFYGEPDHPDQLYDHKDNEVVADVVQVYSDPIAGIDAKMDNWGRIEGVVREAGSGKPLEGVWACAQGVLFETHHDCALTTWNGSYTISGLRRDEYAVEFLPQGNQLWQVYDHKESLSDADLVSIEYNAIVTGIDADLSPAARVEGVVRRVDNRQPLPGVEICALGIEEEGEEEVFGCAYSGSNGSYSISGLPTDEYLIEFWPPDPKWQVQFWDHKANWEEADPLLLAAGTTTTGIDADMAPEPPPQLPPVVPSPVVSKPLSTPPLQLQALPPQRMPRHCRKSSYRKGVGSKARCVRRHKHHHHRHLGTGPQSG